MHAHLFKDQFQVVAHRRAAAAKFSGDVVGGHSVADHAKDALLARCKSAFTLINRADACNIFWQVGSSATLGTASVFNGTILALASASVGTGATIDGRLLARTAAVTLLTDIVTEPRP